MRRTRPSGMLPCLTSYHKEFQHLPNPSWSFACNFTVCALLRLMGSTCHAVLGAVLQL